MDIGSTRVWNMVKFHAIIPTYAVGGWVVVVGLDCALSAAESQMLM